MQKNNKFFDDIAKLASSAGGTFLEMKTELEAQAATQVDKVLRRMDLVTREDFNTVRDMAVKARSEQERLEKRIVELEKLLGAKAKAAPKPAPSPKPTSKTAAPKKAASPKVKKP